MFRHPLVAPANERTDRRRGRVENVDTIFFNDFPESIGLRPVWCSLVHDGRRTIRQRAVNNVTMARDPANIGCTPKNVFIADVEDVFHGRVNADEITASRMYNSLRFGGRATRIEEVERMLAIERRRWTVC